MLAYNWNRILHMYGPIVFMKDGLVTRQSVNSFDELYSLGSARRHECANGAYILYGIFWIRLRPKSKKKL